jgi:hypothetical protein
MLRVESRIAEQISQFSRCFCTSSFVSGGVFLLFHAGVLLIFMLRTLHRHQNLPAA